MLAKLVGVSTLCLGLGLAAPAQADWYEASSDHFVIYADDSEKDIRIFSENLERYHDAMAYVTGRTVDKPSPSNRVVIFVVGSGREVRQVIGTDNRYLAGFYIPRAGGSRAFVQDIKNRSGELDFSTILLLHEYAHHFLIASSHYAMPRWMSEGGAEFFASASFNRDGSMMIGRPALHRAGELAFANDVSVRELLDHELYERNRGKRYDAYYGRSWLLYHYLTFDPERRGQLTEYWRKVTSGMTPLAAGEAVFGDLDALEKQLGAYLRQRRMFTFNVPAEKLDIGEITLRRLPEGEARMMEVRIRSQRGVDDERAAELVVKAREIARGYPDDPGVLTALAEAEYDAGFDDAAIAAADRAIALDPSRANAYVQKGYALFRKAEDAEDPDAAFTLAMKPFSQLNAIENDHPLPLIYYYRSYVQRGAEPPENAKHALERASQLAPFDQSLATNVAIMQATEGKLALAAETLAPVAADPHGSERARFAQKLTAALKLGTEGERFDFGLMNRILDIDVGDVQVGEDADSEAASSDKAATDTAP